MITINKDEQFIPEEQLAGFWNNNIQKIEELHQEILQFLNTLETEFRSFDELYNELKRRVDVFASIYSDFNTIGGKEQVLQLKALIDCYRRKFLTEGIDVPLMESLMSHIKDKRTRSFEEFPLMHHCIGTNHTTAKMIVSYDSYPNRWITFMQNGSWFITHYNELSIIEPGSYQIIRRDSRDYITINSESSTYRVRVFFQRPDIEPESNNYVIIINGGEKNYSASIVGRKIFAHNDIIKTALKPYRNINGYTISPGRFRLFGITHLVLI